MLQVSLSKLQLSVSLSVSLFLKSPAYSLHKNMNNQVKPAPDTVHGLSAFCFNSLISVKALKSRTFGPLRAAQCVSVCVCVWSRCRLKETDATAHDGCATEWEGRHYRSANRERVQNAALGFARAGEGRR